MKLEFKFNGAMFDLTAAVERAIALKDQIRASRGNPTRIQYLENQLSALFFVSLEFALDPKLNHFKKL